MATDRSRSPQPCRRSMMSGGSAYDDVMAAQELRKSYKAPPQSKFRVAAVLRFRRADGSEGVIEAVNAEPHDGNIRGAICAERAALCRFQREHSCGASRLRDGQPHSDLAGAHVPRVSHRLLRSGSRGCDCRQQDADDFHHEGLAGAPANSISIPAQG
eukprot:CAMPEP_0115560806 /NCGR_PEP_ID=MMETSP0271-20121206/100659_1 /TAXON_ID=71861 /ORGANISM="Scrippsiella trochoidea, Strain CCMP3099" /LENGTH=157 /DNA_ID=CAMNT_0002994895 /DNA_START=125 /DNA_END=594 /DNA_ORIENTATION=+